MPIFAHDTPAGGAPLEDLVAASIVALAGMILLGWIALRYRAGAMAPLRGVAATSERLADIPSWSALPSLMASGALLIAVFGFYWDVSTHIDNGRDAGPFANPAHWFILAGLVGIAVAGYLAFLLGDRHPSALGLRAGGWSIPLGGAMILICGVVALAGFPLDDVWHRLFGQDVTLWGPTHIQMVGGASLTTLGIWVLFRETPRGAAGQPWTRALLSRREALMAGAFLIGLSTLQGEFDFGVPQFQLLYHPILVMLAAGIGLTAARVRLGPGGALRAAAFFLVVRAVLWLLVGPVLGRIDLHFPLYLGEALLVEAAASRLGTERSLRFALVTGALIGTAGLAAEWAWTHLWMPIPWPAALLPEAAVLGLAAASSGAVVGVWIGRALDRSLDADRLPVWAVTIAVVIAVACLAYPSAATSEPVRAAVELSDRSSIDGDPHALVTVRLDPPDAARDALWFHTLAYQGLGWRRGQSRLVELIPTGEGTFRTTEPIPVGGRWKTLIRLHRGRSIVALPLFLPADPAIPAAEVPVTGSFERSFIADKEILQREAVGGNPTLQRLGYAVLGLIAAGWLVTIAWALARLGKARLAPPDEQVRLKAGTARA